MARALHGARAFSAMYLGPALVSTRGLGQEIEVFSHPAIVTCPECSYFVDGTCIVCPNGDPHPACRNCRDGALIPEPWYKRQFVISVAVGIVASLSAAIMIAQIRKTRVKALM